ncbi:MAG TPA: CHASE3 domain-containing protein [Terracidiphilus sp.]
MKRFSVYAAFAVLLVVLVGNGLLTRRELGKQIASQERLGDARRVLLQLEKTESLITDAETGQRGFLYTGDANYLAPYEVARTQIETQTDALAGLTADDPGQRAKVAQLRDLEHQKLDELAQTIELYRTGKIEQAHTVVLSDSGRVIMDRIRNVIDQIEQQQTVQENARRDEYRGSIRRSIGSIYLASLLATVGLLLLAYYILREMTLRERYSRDLREQEEWFRVTLKSIGDAVIVTDESGRISFLNAVASTLTGTTLAEARGREIQDVFPIFNEFTGAPTQNPVSRVMTEGRVIGLANHTVLKHTDGHLIPIEDSAAPIRDDHGKLIGVVLVFRDVTNERKSQELLRRSEKLTAAARLSATVAHEINNPLEAVGNLIYIAKQSASAAPDIVLALDLAEQELERVAHITRQTLGFYRESNEARQIDLPALIESVLRLYSNKLNSKAVRVEREFESCPPLLGVPGELKQVISNLVSNAVDAVKANGEIRFKLHGVEDGNGGRIRLMIEDDGPGVPPEIAERIFEPFFTTKKDIGTGLGLWVTKEIIERHGGNISVRPVASRNSTGAAFVIDLPCHADGEPEPPLIQPA